MVNDGDSGAITRVHHGDKMMPNSCEFLDLILAPKNEGVSAPSLKYSTSLSDDFPGLMMVV